MPIDLDTTHQQALEYIHSHHVLCLATSEGEQPWVAPVYYVFRQGKFVFLSAPHTRHCRQIAENARVAASIQQDYSNWEEIKGIQLQGTVQQVEDSRRDLMLQSYAARFPVIGDDAPAAIANALDKISWFELTPTTIFYIDNSRGLGHRSELDTDLLAHARSAN